MSAATAPTSRPRVVIVGGGFGGLQTARGLRRADADVVVVDRVNHHLFQPLLYQVSTALLAPGDIAPALRTVLADQPNATVVLGEVGSVDTHAHTLTVTTVDGRSRELGYDHLVLAAGAQQSYFGHDDWRDTAPPMKSLADAVALRQRLLNAFESAAVAVDDEARRAWLTFVVVGAGPTGVEIAGQIAALARRTLRREFPHLPFEELSILVVDAGDRVLGPFAQPLRDHATRSLHDLGVEVVLGRAAQAIDADGITVAPTSGDGSQQQRIATHTVIWAAGVSPSPLARQVAAATGADTDKGGRLVVGPDCSIDGHPEIFAIGDLANVRDLPGLAEPAMQEGRFVADVIARRLSGRRPRSRFRYLDLGTMATIAPLDAVAQIGPLKLSGPWAKAAWAGVHLAFLVGWGNRVAVLSSWLQTLMLGSRRRQVILDAARADRR